MPPVVTYLYMIGTETDFVRKQGPKNTWSIISFPIGWGPLGFFFFGGRGVCRMPEFQTKQSVPWSKHGIWLYDVIWIWMYMGYGHCTTNGDPKWMDIETRMNITLCGKTQTRCTAHWSETSGTKAHPRVVHALGAKARMCLALKGWVISPSCLRTSTILWWDMMRSGDMPENSCFQQGKWVFLFKQLANWALLWEPFNCNFLRIARQAVRTCSNMGDTTLLNNVGHSSLKIRKSASPGYGIIMDDMGVPDICYVKSMAIFVNRQVLGPRDA